MSHPPQVRPEEPIAVTPHDGICGGESQQWLSYPTNPHVRFDERGRGNGVMPHGPSYRARPRLYRVFRHPGGRRVSLLWRFRSVAPLRTNLADAIGASRRQTLMQRSENLRFS